MPEQARAAIDPFFSQTNLTALRELAMQTAAARSTPTSATAPARRPAGVAQATSLVGID